jgi:glycosyltransferase involved in cell wall biosynthesis
MRGAAAFVFPVHEDFGIVPVEAMACGTAVVGIAAGGLLETVEDGVSGRLASQPDADLLAKAVADLPSTPASEISVSAQQFSAERFRREVAAWVDEAVAV